MSLYRPGLGLDPCRSATASGRRTAAPALWPAPVEMDQGALLRPSSHVSDSDLDGGYKEKIGADAEPSDGW